MSDKLRKLVTDAQDILAAYSVPDSGISEHECVNCLLALLDGPQSREALAPSSTTSGLSAKEADAIELAVFWSNMPDGATDSMNNAGARRLARAYLALKALRSSMRDAQPSTVAAPEGWQLVPKEPTNDMVDAAVHCLDGVNLSKFGKHVRWEKPLRRYRAMLAAAPVPPSSASVAREEKKRG